MSLEYIIVQAGGRGSRMGALTVNKPKALVPVENLPMLFHLFQKFPTKKFIIIGDYKYSVLEKYLREFSKVDYQLVSGSGHSGTCAGLAKAASFIPEKERFLIIWCDLVLPSEYEIPTSKNNIIGIAKDFPCRWKYEQGEFVEEYSREHGVAGFFIFADKKYISDVPEDGEFVRWLQKKKYFFEEQILHKTKEYGLFTEWDKLSRVRCRPFNHVEIKENRFYKMAVDEQGKVLAKRETAWYQKMQEIVYENIPKIYGYDPLCMELIEGKNIYEYTDIPSIQKKEILCQVITCLKELHSLGHVLADWESFRLAYLEKTYERLKKVRHLVPLADERTVKINGRVCRNIFYQMELVEKLVMHYMPKEFCLIHGDCTFSNIMLKKDKYPILLDPRGYFGNIELFGDPAYDWAKIYYSLYSNYDQFNLKHFQLVIDETDKMEIHLDIASNNWEDLEEDFFDMLDGEVTKEQMKLFVAIFWLSLTTYAWEDYDSICGAFYNGIYYLEEALP